MKKFIPKSIRNIQRIAHILKKYTSYKIGSNYNNENCKFVLIRIIGNDLVNFHSNSQSKNNLKFIVEHESEFENCTKIYIVNRIFDKKKEDYIISFLNDKKLKYFCIPFDILEYKKIDFDFLPFNGPEFFNTSKYRTYKENVKTMMKLATCRKKILYAMNVNGARNKAMEIGAEYGDWIFPWDGNCTLSAKSYKTIQQSCIDKPYLPVKVIPLIRQEGDQNPFADDIKIDKFQEPQLLIHKSLGKPFNEAYAYGMRSKTELLKRLGVPGPWQSEKAHFFLPDTMGQVGLRFEYEVVGAHTIRLSSGIENT